MKLIKIFEPAFFRMCVYFGNIKNVNACRFSINTCNIPKVYSLFLLIHLHFQRHPNIIQRRKKIMGMYKYEFPIMKTLFVC